MERRILERMGRRRRSYRLIKELGQYSRSGRGIGGEEKVRRSAEKGNETSQGAAKYRWLGFISVLL
jgi:hypothetical protein